jgi:SAM-dependent methyltransferase
MKDALNALRVLGLGPVLKLYRGYRLAWQGTLNGFYNTRIIQSLFNVGFFDEMQRKGAVDPEAFARSRNLDPEILDSLCVALYAMRFLGKSANGSYVLDTKGRLLVEMTRGWFDGVYGYEEMVHHLEALLKKQMVYGTDLRRRADFVAVGSGEIENRFYFPLAIDMIKRHGWHKVMDLGCGDGTFLRRLCEQINDVTGCGLDIAPEAIAAGRQQVRSGGLEDRVQLCVGDINALEELPEPLRSVEATTVFFVLHEVLFDGPDKVITLLQSYRRLFHGVPLIVFEVIRPTPEEMRRRPGMAVQYVLQHDLSHQKLVDSRQWREMFRAVGFQSIDEQYLGFARTAIFTLR